MRALPLLAIGLLVIAFAVPAANADVKPRQLQAASCSAVKIGEKGHVLYRLNVSCSFAKRWARRLAATQGRRKPRGWTCTSGSKFRSGGHCEKGPRDFGWYRGD